MKEDSINYLLEQAATRAAESEFFFARVFREYEKIESLHAADLARYLGCTMETLTRIALCRRPAVDDPSRFKSDIEQISQHFGVDDVKLASLVRYVNTMGSFFKSPQLAEEMFEQGVLLTARDQEELGEQEEGEEEEESEEEKDRENDA